MASLNQVFSALVVINSSLVNHSVFCFGDSNRSSSELQYELSMNLQQKKEIFVTNFDKSWRVHQMNQKCSSYESKDDVIAM